MIPRILDKVIVISTAIALGYLFSSAYEDMLYDNERNVISIAISYWIAYTWSGAPIVPRTK